MFSLAVFLFPVIKRAEKVSGFVSVRAEGKYEINYKKKNFFFSFSLLFYHFWSSVCRKRSIGIVSGVRRRNREQKKSNLKKKVLSAFFRHSWSEKQSVCG